MSLNAKLLALLSSKYRKSFYGFLFFSVLFALFESAGLAFILPYLEVISSYASGEPNQQIQTLSLYFGVPADKVHIVYIASFLLFALMFIKYALQIYVSYLSAVLPYDIYQYHGNLLAKKYSRLSWVQFSQHNTNEIIKNVTKSNELLAYSYVVYLQFLTSVIIVLFLVIVLLIVNFKSAVVLLCLFSVLGGVTYTSMRSSQVTAGEDRELGLSQVYKQASELFLSNREIKITGTTKFFENNFSGALKKLAGAFKKTTFYPRVPVVVIELGAVVILLLVVILAVEFQYDLEVLIGYLIFYAAVGKRLLPSISTLIFCKSTLKNLTPTIENLFQDLHQEVEKNQDELVDPIDNAHKKSDWSVISLEEIFFSYREKKQVLANLSFTIHKNKRIAFIGPSGAGKSTIIDILTGLLKPESGVLRIDGIEIKDFSILNPNLGYVPQMPVILDTTIAENVAFGQKRHDEKKLADALKMAHLTDFIESLESGVDTVVGERGVRLSGGQRQRLSIARALYNDPEIIVFDEATSALDNVSEKIVSDAIDGLAASKTIICVAHRLSTIQHFDIIYFVNNGRVTHKGTHHDLLRECSDYRKMNEISDQE